MQRLNWRYEIGKALVRSSSKTVSITQIPLIGDMFFKGFFEPDDYGKVIPVNKSIGNPEDIVLPSEIVRQVIEASSHRFIMEKCLCRLAEGCINYPEDLGCIWMAS